MFELAKIVKKKYKDFDITPRQLRNVIRDNNITRKRTRHEHFPITRYGTPDNTIVCIGDWEQRKHRKFKDPIKGLGFRKMFRKSGFRVYLVDEFRTSCKCSNCEGGECSKFREIRNPKPTKNNSFLSYGLLLCKKDCG